MFLLYGVVERARVDSRWIKTTFFFLVPGVRCRWVFAGGFIGLVSAVRFLILACSTSLMTTLTTGSLEKDLLASPASTGIERAMNATETAQAPRAHSLAVAKEPNDAGPLRLP